jgi:hypothetical protein
MPTVADGLAAGHNADGGRDEWRQEGWYVACGAASAANKVATDAAVPTAEQRQWAEGRDDGANRTLGKESSARRRSRNLMTRESRSDGGTGRGAAATAVAGGTRLAVDRPSQVGSVASAGAIARARCTGPDKQYRVRI